MFETALRLNLRFDSPKGLLTIEDLWDLPLTASAGKANLDEIAKNLFHQLRNTDDVSFVNPAQKADATVQVKFDIVKHIIDIRVAERDVAAVARANKERKQLILGIIAQKENENLLGTSLDDLKKMADAL